MDSMVIAVEVYPRNLIRIIRFAIFTIEFIIMMKSTNIIL